jgi:DNA polymerase III subunit epsilon
MVIFMDGAALSDLRFAVVDVETSGRKPTRHHVLQLGVVIVDGEGAVLDRWGSLLAPAHRPWFRVGPTKVHGIHRNDLRHAPPAVDVLRHLASSLEGARLVAHNASFDVAFLRKAAARHGVAIEFGDPLCTLRLSRRLDPERQQAHGLAAVCARYGVPLHHAHDALADATATAAVLPHLLRAHGIGSGAQLPAAS